MQFIKKKSVLILIMPGADYAACFLLNPSLTDPSDAIWSLQATLSW